MNRDLFPRFWAANDKEMIYWQCYMQNAFNSGKSDDYGFLFKLFKGYFGSIMLLCTGLRDKNEKLIYEDDLIKYKDHNSIYVVKWSDDQAIFYFDDALQPTKYSSYVFDSEMMKDIEVIGNIHENPDLLEQSDVAED